MLSVNVQISGDKETIAKLQRMKGGLTDWQPELSKAGEFLKNFYQNQVFESEGGIFGMKWATLRASYDFYKRKTFPGRGILQRSGTLRRSYQYQASAKEMILRNPVPYAIFHQYGTSKMPARVLVRVDQARKEAIINIFKAGMANKLRKAL